eukprot:Hpha_TRINITY_DN16789_c0_g6::TRINITY_DN16789_c0_g6_i1::g.80399::m.80399
MGLGDGLLSVEIGMFHSLNDSNLSWLVTGRDRGRGKTPASSSGSLDGLQKFVHQVVSRLGDGSAGPEDEAHAGVVELLVILLWDHAPGDDEDVTTIHLLKLLDQLGNEGTVTGGLRRHTNDVHVRVDGSASHLSRRLEEGGDIDVESHVSEARAYNLRAAVVPVLTHLRHQHTRAATGLGLEALDLGGHGGQDVTPFASRILARVHTPDHAVLGDVTADSLLNRKGDLTESGTGTGGLDTEGKEVALGGVPSGLLDGLERLLHRRVVTLRLQGVDLINLLLAHSNVVDLQHVVRLLLALRLVLVHTNDRVHTGVDVRLLLGSGGLDTELRHTLHDALSHTALALDFIDDRHRLVHQLIGQRLHHVRPGPGVNHLSDSSLLLEDELSVTRELRTEGGGETHGLVEGVGVEGLRTPHHRRHRLRGGTDDIVVGLLLGEGPPTGLRVRAQQQRLVLLRVEVLLHQRCPQGPRGPKLGDLHVEVHTDTKEEGKTGGAIVHGLPGLDRGADVLQTIRNRERQLKRSVRTGLLNVVPTDGDGVELGLVLAHVTHNVRDDAHRGLGGVDVGVPHHELL